MPALRESVDAGLFGLIDDWHGSWHG